MGLHEGGSPVGEPADESPLGGHPVWHSTFLCPLPQYPDQTSVLVDVTQVKSTQFGDTHSRRVQQFYHCMVTQSDRFALGSSPLRGLKRQGRLFRVQHLRQRPLRPRRDQARAWIAFQQTCLGSPRGEGASCRSTPGQRTASASVAVLGSQPMPQQREIQRRQIVVARADQVPQQGTDVGSVGPHRMR